MHKIFNTYIDRIQRRIIVPLIKPARIIFESFGISVLSKPYLHHDAFMKYFNFDGGFFVEVGGNDGYEASPTYFLEKFKGWQGVLVEPLPELTKKCANNRKMSRVYNFACVANTYPEETITLMDKGPMTVVKGGFSGWDNWGKSKGVETVVPARTLTSILDEAQVLKIDLFVLDVEGYESKILEGFDLERFKPEYILTEAYTDERKVRIEELLGKEYFLVETFPSTREFLYRTAIKS